MAIHLSLDSQGSDAQRAALWNEVETVLGRADDPLEILIAEEEDAHEGCGFVLNDID